MHNNNNIPISYSNESLRKRQPTMCIFMNTEKGDLRDVCTALMCKSSCLGRYKAVEKLVWDTRVSMLFQKKT